MLLPAVVIWISSSGVSALIIYPLILDAYEPSGGGLRRHTRLGGQGRRGSCALMEPPHAMPLT